MWGHSRVTGSNQRIAESAKHVAKTQVSSGCLVALAGLSVWALMAGDCWGAWLWSRMGEDLGEQCVFDSWRLMDEGWEGVAECCVMELCKA